MTWRTDADGRCTWVSDGWCRFVGRDAESQRGRGWLDAVHLGDRKRVAGDAARHQAQRRPFLLYYRLRHHSGRDAVVCARGMPQTDPRTGEFVGYWGGVTECARVRTDNQRPAAVLPFAVRHYDEAKSIELQNQAVAAHAESR